ncbi:Transposable element P transposase [Amphibalanus amphitrite]|nr:Transposable element P transposase [Amphibalanus amphitrite]
MFADAPHLLKLLRNYVLDEGVRLPGGGLVNKDLMTDVLGIDGDKEFKMLPKLGVKSHIEVKGQARQKVRPAAQLLSSSVATALEMFHPEKKEEADFIRLCDSVFDVLNGHSPGDAKPLKRGLGHADSPQLQVLADFEQLIQTMQIGTRTTLLPFQQGFLMSIKSVRGLMEDSKSRYGPGTYILPGKVNQDI